MRFDITAIDPVVRKDLTYLVPDVKNPHVKWEMGLVSARAIKHPSGSGVVDYQAVWRLPRGVVRGSIVVTNGKVTKGSMAYFDPRIYAETRLEYTAWVWERFETNDEFQSATKRIAAAVSQLPVHEPPTINWSPESLCPPMLTRIQE